MSLSQRYEPVGHRRRVRDGGGQPWGHAGQKEAADETIAEFGRSIAFTSQLHVEHWNEVIPNAVIFDAIRDRLEHSALTINITGETYRGVKARKPASTKQDA